MTLLLGLLGGGSNFKLSVRNLPLSYVNSVLTKQWLIG